MSWFSNISGVKTPPPVDLSSAVNDSTGPEKTKEVPSVGQWSNFDPTGLERAAKAAKDLERSRNAKEAIDLARIQEVTKQNEYQTKIKEYENYSAKIAIEKIRVQEDEKRKTIESETNQYKRRADYSDKLARDRLDKELAQKDKMNQKLLSQQEESVKKQEGMRKATIDYKANLKKDNDMAVMQAKIRAQGKMRRENHDLELESLRAKMSEYRTTILDTLRTGADIVSSGFSGFVNNPYQISVVCATILGMSFGLKSIRAGVNISSNYIESKLGKPTLIRETSRFNTKELMAQASSRLWKAVGKDENKVMRGIFLDRVIEDQLIRVSISTINTKKNNGYYRNLLFYGPPGTGKTLFAKSMAHTVGMDYAIMTGGDVAPLGKDSVTSLHKVFKWAASSRKGLLLFIDEADAFLKKRNKEHISEDLRNALNSFLYHTGESSKNFMLVLATNQPDQLDRAISDRIDELVEFQLPQLVERKRLLTYYFNKFIKDEKNIKISQDVSQEEASMLEELAKSTEGLSGREISKLAISWQASAYASHNGVLTKEMVLNRAREMSEQHDVKRNWENTKSADYLNL